MNIFQVGLETLQEILFQLRMFQVAVHQVRLPQVRLLQLKVVQVRFPQVRGTIVQVFVLVVGSVGSVGVFLNQVRGLYHTIIFLF